MAVVSPRRLGVYWHLRVWSERAEPGLCSLALPTSSSPNLWCSHYHLICQHLMPTQSWNWLTIFFTSYIRFLWYSYICVFKEKIAVTMTKKQSKIKATILESTGTSPGIWNLVYGLLTEDDSGLPTGPLTITKTLLNISLTHWTLGLIHVLSLATQTLKTFVYNVPLELGGLPHVLLLAVHMEWLVTPSWHSGVLRSSIWTM